MRNYILFLLFFVTQIGVAQTPVLQALVSKEVVEVDGRFTISFRFNASGDKFTPPSNLSENFRVLSGPNKSSEMSYINGSMSSSVSYSYILSPIQKGSFTIEAASMESDDKIYTSNKVKIKVVDAQNNSGNGQQYQNQQEHQEQQKKIAKENLFLKLVLNKKSVYQGEQVIATYKLYNRTRLNGIEGQRMPEFDGFYTSDIEINGNNNHTREVLNGVEYDVFVLKKTILIPLKTGELTLIPLEIDANIQIQDSKPVNTWFGPQYRYKNASVSLKSNSEKLNVKALPKGAPNSFSGAVGSFKFSTTCEPKELKVNEALTYSIKISGTGNLPLIDNPIPNWPQEFEVYDPKLKSNFNTKTNSISGSKTWEYLSIPRNGGDYSIEPLEFTYFDLATKKYVTIAGDVYPVKVSGVAENQTSSGTFGVNRQEVERLSTDIRFIRTRNPNLQIIDNHFFGTVWYYFWMIIPVFLSGLAYFIIQKQNELNSDTIGMKKRKATKLAKNLLRQAENKLKENDNLGFHDAIFKGLNGYISDKLSISKADLNKPFIAKKLTTSNVSSETVTSFLETLDHCEMARFAPSSNISNQELLTQAQTIIIKLEDEIK